MLGTIETRNAYIVQQVEAGARVSDLARELGLSTSAVSKEAPSFIPWRTVGELVAAASRISNISTKDITGKARFRHIVRVRQAVMYLAWFDGHSTHAIGRRLGGKDHSTVIHARDSVPGFMARDDEYRDLVERIDAAVPKRRRNNMRCPWRAA